MGTKRKPHKAASFHIDLDELALMVERLQRGETAIHDEIYDRFYKKFYGQIFLQTRDHALTEILVNNVFEEITNKICTLRNPKAFVLWANKIVVAQYNDYYRQKYREEKRMKKEAAKRAVPAYKRRAWTPEEKIMLQQRLNQIPAKQASVMELHYIQELSIEEISQALALPIGTVKSRLYYGRQAFLHLLRPKSALQEE